jgi:hypothetical protein
MMLGEYGMEEEVTAYNFCNRTCTRKNLRHRLLIVRRIYDSGIPVQDSQTQGFF